MNRVRKAVFPAAGLGTRFLPATKAQPKEMLPLVDKPIIQYGVEEAVASGVDNIILVTGRGKNAIEDHFDVSVELETFLESRGRDGPPERDPQDLEPDQLRLRPPGRAARPRPRRAGHRGTGRPTSRSRSSSPTTSSTRTPPALAQIISVFNQVQGPVLAVERVPDADVSSYGIVDVAETIGPGVYRLRDLVEKPPTGEAPSNLAIIGRYVLTPDVFGALKDTRADRTGEIQLTNGLRRLLEDRPLYACEVQGVRHDTGNKHGYLRAVVYFALRRPDLAGPSWNTCDR